MKSPKSGWLGSFVVLSLAMAGFYFFRAPSSSAQVPAAAAPDAAAALATQISTQVISLTEENQKGEPQTITGRAKFSGRVLASWVSVVGADIRFTKDGEHPFNRQVFAVDPFAKVINGTDVEISGKLGVRDGSGNWDDPYEGTITVAVTAITAR